jgi:hypothetical protein
MNETLPDEVLAALEVIHPGLLDATQYWKTIYEYAKTGSRELVRRDIIDVVNKRMQAVHGPDYDHAHLAHVDVICGPSEDDTVPQGLLVSLAALAGERHEVG